MKILVIGGAGYIGSVLIRRLLNEGYNVVVFDKLLFGGESLIDLFTNPHFKFIFGDIRNRNDIKSALRDANIVINLAAIVGEPLCAANPKIAKDTNYKSACLLAEEAKKQGISKFIFASTCSNYGISKQNELATEESLVNPISLYAKTKVNAEKYILSLSSPKFSPTVLRLSTAYGLSPRMRLDLLVSEFVKEAFVSNTITVYKPNAWRPLVHVQDISTAIIACIKAPRKKVNGQIFNVGFNNYKKIDIVSLIKKKMPKLKLIIQEDKGDNRDYKVSFDKINKQLKVKAKFSVEEGISEVLKILSDGIIYDPTSYRYTNINWPKK